MCFGCYSLSVMTLFSPVNEAPQPANLPALSQLSTQTQFQKVYTPDEMRASIASILQRLPRTSNTKVLHDAFSKMQTQLVGVSDQNQVYNIVNDSMLSLFDQVFAAPNPVELFQILQDAQKEVFQPQASGFLNSQWGWLS